MKRITIYEVAKQADVSLATVSRVINGSDMVREDTRLRVQKAIEKLGYKPNAIAQGLALQKTTTIALVLPEASYTYTGQIINGLMDVARIYKYNVSLHTTSEGLSEMNEVIETVLTSRADGVIIYNDKLYHDELATLNKYNVPIVVIGNKISGELISSVYVDIRRATYDLTKSYLAKGYRNIAILQDRKHKRSIEKLVEGAREAFAEYELPFDNCIEITSEYRTSYAFMSKYFETSTDLQLLICYRDSHALAALNAAREHNIKVPDDLEIVCVIDTKYNTMVRPQLSSFAIPAYDLGAVAMRVMTKVLNGEEKIDHEIELSYLYTPRKSTK